jgi:hypothetical protein
MWENCVRLEKPDGGGEGIRREDNVRYGERGEIKSDGWLRAARERLLGLPQRTHPSVPNALFGDLAPMPHAAQPVP